MQVGLLDVRGENDVRHAVDRGDLLFHGRDDLVDRACEIDAGDELEARVVLWELGVHEGEGPVGETRHFGEGGFGRVGKGFFYTGPAPGGMLEGSVECGGRKVDVRDAGGAEDEKMVALGCHFNGSLG